MEETDNKELVNLINKYKEEKSMELQGQILSLIVKSRFMCPVIMQTAPKGGGKVQIGRDTKIEFSIIRTSDNRNFLIAFTSDEEVNKWQSVKTQQSLIYTFEDYATIVTNEMNNVDGFIIDPKGCNLVLTRDMINAIKQSITTETTIGENTTVNIGIPKDYPEELANKLKDMFANFPAIKKAYLLLMTTDKKTYLLIVDADGNEKAYFNSIASASIPFLNGMPLSMLEANTELGKRVANDFEPFYVAE